MPTSLWIILQNCVCVFENVAICFYWVGQIRRSIITTCKLYWMIRWYSRNFRPFCSQNALKTIYSFTWRKIHILTVYNQTLLLSHLLHSHPINRATDGTISRICIFTHEYFNENLVVHWMRLGWNESSRIGELYWNAIHSGAYVKPRYDKNK